AVAIDGAAVGALDLPDRPVVGGGRRLPGVLFTGRRSLDHRRLYHELEWMPGATPEAPARDTIIDLPAVDLLIRPGCQDVDVHAALRRLRRAAMTLARR